MRGGAVVKSIRTREQSLELGRESFRTHAWRSAFSELSAADAEAPLDPEDLALLAQAALLTGKEAEFTDVLARAHQAFLAREDALAAVRCAFWVGFNLMLRGEFAKAGGWLARAARLLEDQPECVENGYLLLPEAFRTFQGGDPGAAYSLFVRAFEIGNRYGEKDLAALALQGQGRSLIRRGEVARGLTLLDEAMVSVTAGEVSALTAGGVYCSVIEGCGEVFDLQRAAEWTAELDRWCTSQPDLVPFRGHCLVRRAEMLQFHGEWPQAMQSAQGAIARLPALAGPGAAYYQMAEIHRMRGKFAEAEEAFQEAGKRYRCTGPGLARLRLAQGRTDAATAIVQRLAAEVHDTGPRALILDCLVEVAIAAGDAAAAGAAAGELAEIARR